jgi:hypothetical protein
MEAGVLIRYLKISVKEREIGEKKKKGFDFWSHTEYSALSKLLKSLTRISR